MTAGFTPNPRGRHFNREERLGRVLSVSLRTPGVVISTRGRHHGQLGRVSLRTPGVVISTQTRPRKRAVGFHSEPQGSSFQQMGLEDAAPLKVSLRTPGVVISTCLAAQHFRTRVSLRTPGVVISTLQRALSRRQPVSLRTPGVVISTRFVCKR